MSVGVSIYPTKKAPILCAELLHKLEIDTQFIRASGPIKMQGIIELPERRAMAGSEQLTISGIYALGTLPANAVIISFLDNNLQPFSEHLMLDDVGKNLDDDFRFELGNLWHRAGFSISISSMASRLPQEPTMLIGLSACIAELCDGYVSIYENGIFSLDIGTYSPAKFRSAQPRFSGIGPFEMNV